jgi:hypothetical protein
MTELPTGGSLVAERAPTPDLEGAGVVSSWADVADAVAKPAPDGMEIAWAAAGAGLDTLGAIADPFDALMSSSIGWLIEHVWFLREPLDALAGDPLQVTAQAQTWSNIAGELRAVAAEQHTAAQVTGWAGPSGEAYRGAVGRYTGAVVDVAGQADQLAQLVLGSGAAVGTVRALVRDLIADFLGWVARTALAALAAATVTLAGSTAAAITAVALEAYRLARTIAERVSSLLDALSHAAATAGALVVGMRHTAAVARARAHYMQDPLGQVPAAEVVEAGKQFSATALENPPPEQQPSR